MNGPGAVLDFVPSAHVVRLAFVVSYSACSNKVGFPVDCCISVSIYRPAFTG